MLLRCGCTSVSMWTKKMDGWKCFLIDNYTSEALPTHAQISKKNLIHCDKFKLVNKVKIASLKVFSDLIKYCP